MLLFGVGVLAVLFAAVFFFFQQPAPPAASPSPTAAPASPSPGLAPENLDPSAYGNSTAGFIVELANAIKGMVD